MHFAQVPDVRETLAPDHQEQNIENDNTRNTYHTLKKKKAVIKQ
jgi:hypothetical protein